MVKDKEGRKAEDGFQIDGAQRQDRGVGSQCPGNFMGNEQSGSEKGYSRNHCGKEGQGKGLICLFLLALGTENGIAGSSAGSQHHPQAIDQAEDGNGDIQGGQPAGTQPV